MASGVVIEGNLIGLAADGSSLAGNGFDGIALNGGSSDGISGGNNDNTIGGTIAGAGNIISGNGATESNSYQARETTTT